MKRYLLPVALCFYWATSIQVSIAEVCPIPSPSEEPITQACEAYLKSNLEEENFNKVVECIRKPPDKAGKTECRSELDKARNSLPKYHPSGTDPDTSPMKFIRYVIKNL